MIIGSSVVSRISAGHKRSSVVRWSLIVVVFVALIFGVATILLARNWPFTRQAVTTALQDRFARTVEIFSLATEPRNRPPTLFIGTAQLRKHNVAATAGWRRTWADGLEADFLGVWARPLPRNARDSACKKGPLRIVQGDELRRYDRPEFHHQAYGRGRDHEASGFAGPNFLA